MNGYEVLSAIKTDENLRTIPAIVFSTSAADVNAHKSYRLLANAYMKKPATIGEYAAVIESLGFCWAESVDLPT